VPPLVELPINPLAIRAAGFSLHATTVCEARQCIRLKRLRHYITRPPIAPMRLTIDCQG